FLPQGSLFICDARHLKDKLIELGADQAKVQLIYFGTDVRKFHPDRKDRSIWKELGFEEGVSIVLSLRALKPIYDVRTFILSIPEILREYGSARFVAVGRGEEKPKLVQLVQELGITEKVRFLEGLSDEAMQKVVASADVYVSTSLSDGGLAASTAEAMACEVPVVVTDFGENGKWVENGVSGFLFPLSDHRELAQKVVDLLKDPAYAKDIARAGRRVIEERNNYYKEMEKTEALYEKIIQG
ncbi:MAG TPA: glycosyltransferase family 4 protein, partial [Candidatus Omnitrophota bacterium]|nr:glycosyltransferase family 4 protein [Candidatus Omnitrophota bacterium]